LYANPQNPVCRPAFFLKQHRLYFRIPYHVSVIFISAKLIKKNGCESRVREFCR
jgi:hypothetical protein